MALTSRCHGGEEIVKRLQRDDLLFFGVSLDQWTVLSLYRLYNAVNTARKSARRKHKDEGKKCRIYHKVFSGQRLKNFEKGKLGSFKQRLASSDLLHKAPEDFTSEQWSKITSICSTVESEFYRMKRRRNYETDSLIVKENQGAQSCTDCWQRVIPISCSKCGGAYEYHDTNECPKHLNSHGNIMAECPTCTLASENVSLYLLYLIYLTEKPIYQDDTDLLNLWLQYEPLNIRPNELL